MSAARGCRHKCCGSISSFKLWGLFPNLSHWIMLKRERGGIWHRWRVVLYQGEIISMHLWKPQNYEWITTAPHVRPVSRPLCTLWEVTEGNFMPGVETVFKNARKLHKPGALSPAFCCICSHVEMACHFMGYYASEPFPSYLKWPVLSPLAWREIGLGAPKELTFIFLKISFPFSALAVKLLTYG